MQQTHGLRNLTIAIGALAAFGVGTVFGQAGNTNGGGTDSTAGRRTSPPAQQQPSVNQPSTNVGNQPTSNAAGAHQSTHNAATAKDALGVKFENAQNGKGLEISTVDQSTPAAQAGLQPKDQIVAVDGRPFTNARHLNAYLSAQAGRRVPIVIERNGRQSTIEVMPARIAGDRAWLGVFLEEDESDSNGANGQNAPQSQKGAMITQVHPAGPAARAGLRPGDVVVQVNGQKIDDSAEFVALVHELKPQARAELVVMRDNQEQKIPVTMGNRNDEFAEGQMGGGQFQEQFPQGQFPGQFPQGQFPGQFGPPRGQFGPGQFQPGQFAQSGAGGMDPNAIQRLEDEVRQLRDEIRQLRDQLQKK